MNKESIRVELVSQFYRKNHCAFFTALIVSVLTGTTGLMVSWLIKEFIDLIAGQSAYTLPQLTLMSVAFIAFALILTVINYHSEPAFVRKAIRQYKEKAFFFLSSKNISSFRNEATSTYLSALTNDAATIEQNYVMSTLQIASKIIPLSIFRSSWQAGKPQPALSISWRDRSPVIRIQRADPISRPSEI